MSALDWPSNKQTIRKSNFLFSSQNFHAFLFFSIVLYICILSGIRLIRYWGMLWIISAAVLSMLPIFLKALVRLVPVFSYFWKPCTTAPLFYSGKKVLPGIQGFLRCLLFPYFSILCLLPDTHVVLIPAGSILAPKWDFFPMEVL